jgi:hypothetical protein
MVFKIITGVVVRVVARVVAGVVGGDEVYHHSSAQFVVGGFDAHLNARGPLLPSCRGKKPCLSMVGVTGV